MANDIFNITSESTPVALKDVLYNRFWSWTLISYAEAYTDDALVAMVIEAEKIGAYPTNTEVRAAVETLVAQYNAGVAFEKATSLKGIATMEAEDFPTDLATLDKMIAFANSKTAQSALLGSEVRTVQAMAAWCQNLAQKAVALQLTMEQNGYLREVA